MTTKQQYWIADAAGNLALVDGADERDLWTKIRGWHEVITDPPANVQVWIWRDDVERPGRVPVGALEVWVGMGWRPGPPPQPVDITKDPALRDLSPEPAKPKPSPAPAADK